MSGDVSIGLIGCGRIARYAHVPALMKAEGVCLRTICDVQRPLAAALAQRYGITHVCDDPDEVFSDDQIEAVLIAVPDRFHIPLARAAIEAGKHVLVEKPLGVSSEECRGFVRLATASGLRIQVGAMKRHDPGYRFAREFVQEVIGRVLSFRCWYGVSTYRYAFEATLFAAPPEGSEMPEDEVAYRADKSRYHLVTHGAHIFDMIRFLAGDPAGVTARSVELEGSGSSWHGLIDLVDGGLGHFELTIPVSRGWDEGFELFGEHGSISVRTPFGFFMQPSEVRAFDAGRGEWRAPLFADSDPWERQLEAFAIAIRTGGPTDPDVEDGLAAVELTEVAATSIETGERAAWRP